MNITIKKSDIYAHVVALTSRAGRIMGNYDKIAASADNEEIMNLHLPPAIAVAEAYLQEHLKATNDLQLRDENEQVVFRFKGEQIYTDRLNGLVATSLRLFLAYRALVDWLYLNHLPESMEIAGNYRDESMVFLNNALNALAQRGVLPEMEYHQRLQDGCFTRAGVLRTDRDIIYDENGLPVTDEEGNILMN